MVIQYATKIWALSLGILLLYAFPAAAQRIVSPLDESSYSRQVVLANLAKAEVVYLGETHNNPRDHQAQLDILRSLYQLHNSLEPASSSSVAEPPLAIALEMFQRPYQGVLDRYLTGELSEAQLQAQSQYQQRWGFPWEYYAPILRFAKQNNLPVLALNTPTEITQKVSRTGLQSLTRPEQRLIPPLSAIKTDNSSYRQFVLRSYQDFHQDKGSIGGFEQFFQAQVLWDETMAETIADFLQINPGTQVIVLAGQGHVIHDYGIPSRVARRVARWSNLSPSQQQFVQYSVLLNPAEESSSAQQPAADYFWYN